MKKIRIDEFTKLKMLSSPRYSKDGKDLCFVLTKPDVRTDSYRSWIYCMKDGAKPEQLTFTGNETDYCISGDSTILYVSKKSPVKTVFRKVSIKTGKDQTAFSVPLSVTEAVELEEGKLLLKALNYPGYEDLYRGDTGLARAYLKEREENRDYEEFSTQPWWADGGTFLRGTYSGLYLYDMAEKQLERLTPEGFDVSTVNPSPDGKTLFILGGAAEKMLMFIEFPDLYVMDTDSKELKCIHPARKDFAVSHCVPGEKYAVVMATDLAHGINTDSDFYTMSYDNYQLTPLLKWDRSIESSVYSDVMRYGGQLMKLEGDTLYFTSAVDEEHPLFKLENGKVTRISTAEGDVKCFDVHNGKIAMVAQLDMKAQELYNEDGRQLTRYNDRQLSGKYVSKPERLTIDSCGREIRGFVYKPIDYEEDGKYPAIMYIHGGPKSCLGPVFFNIFQYWTSEGYFVFCCNPYGSDGRGSEFADMQGKYFTNDYTDLMNFFDAALEKYPQIDRNNVFETGISYGGIMTNWIVGHTDRFAACVSQASISNLVSFSVSDIGPAFGKDQYLATPWTDPMLLWDKSPLKYADKVKTPTMFIHSLSDYRCPIDQGLQMYSALKEFGVDTRFFMIRNESHGLFEIGSPVHKIRYNREMTRWFEEHKKL